MAEKEPSPELAETNPTTQDMDLEIIDSSAQNPNTGDDANGDSKSKREREEEEETDDVSKKQKQEKSVEEERLEKKSDLPQSGPVRLGPKEFGSSAEMFDYFVYLLHHWGIQLNFNKYEHMVLLDLLKKGHLEPERKIGGGIKAFQIRNHPVWNSKCFFVIREDETVDDFSFRKCIDHILPLPDNLKIKRDKASGGGGWKGRGGKGGGRGHGRGGKPRN